MIKHIIIPLLSLCLLGCGMSKYEKEAIEKHKAEQERITNVNEALRRLHMKYEVDVVLRDGGQYRQHFLFEGSVTNKGQKTLTAIYADFVLEYGTAERMFFRVNLLRSHKPLAPGQSYSFVFNKMIQQKHTIVEAPIGVFSHRGQIVSVEL